MSSDAVNSHQIPRRSLGWAPRSRPPQDVLLSEGVRDYPFNGYQPCVMEVLIQTHLNHPGLFVSLGNTEFKVFILIWSLKLEGGRSDFREGTVWGRKVQGLAHRAWGWYLRTAWTCIPSYRRDCPAQALCGNIKSHSRISVLKTVWTPLVPTGGGEGIIPLGC